MINKPVLFASDFDSVNEEDWLKIVARSLKGEGLDKITGQTRDAIAIKPLYRYTDFAAHEDPYGMPGVAPYIRGGRDQPDPFRPWDIRQGFACADPEATNTEILHDLKNGVSSVELCVDAAGAHGVQLCDLAAFETALDGVHADLAPIALDYQGMDNHDVRAAALLALWAKTHDTPQLLALAFNLDPFSALVRTGRQTGNLNTACAQIAALIRVVEPIFPLSTLLRVDARPVHEAGGSEGQELGVLMAHAVDMLRRFQIIGIPARRLAPRLTFTVALDANYGVGIAKLRAARRLWAQVQEALDIDVTPMRLQAVTSMRMLTRYDPWVNILRATAACFAGAAGGADIISVHAFNKMRGAPGSLGRRIARNTQIIAMEESGLGRVADPAGGAWFPETLGENLANTGWKEFQTIEAEGGYGESLVGGHIQGRIATAREGLLQQVRNRMMAITGISTFPLLDEADVPEGASGRVCSANCISEQGIQAFKIASAGPDRQQGQDTVAETLPSVQISASFEVLRDRSEACFAVTGVRPAVCLVTLGPLSEHGARADFAANFLAAGGILAKTIPAGEHETVLAAAYKDSASPVAVLCGSDACYERMAEKTLHIVKNAGAMRVWITGDFTLEGLAGHIRDGGDHIACLETLHAELGIDRVLSLRA